MRKTVTTLLLLLFITCVTHAQETDPMIKFLLKRGYTFPDSIVKRTTPDSLKQWPDTLYYNTVYKPKYLRSPTIPISFSKIEYVDGYTVPAEVVNGKVVPATKVPGQYEVTPVISIGYGYTWFLGDFIFNENDKLIVEPSVYVGLIADAGLQSNFSVQELSLNPYNFLGSIFTGGFIGFGAFTLFVGWDFVSHSPSVGIGGRIDLYTINQKFLKPIGKIKTNRKHKRKYITPMITND